MIFLHSDLLGENNALFFTLVASTLFALLIGIAFHEFCHAFVADRLGDRTPASQGRVTLNPLAHLDPLGTAMMVFVGFGWGKPVQFNPYGLKTDAKRATLLVSLAGPASNFVAAFLLGLPIRFGVVPFFDPLESRLFGINSAEEYVGLFLTAAVVLNIILGVFNLIPIHPLDGFKVVLGLLPEDLSQEWAKLAQYGPPLLLGLIGISYFTDYSPLGDIIGPSASRLLELFTGVG